MVKKAIEVSVHFEGEVFMYGENQCTTDTKGCFVVVFHKFKDGELFDKSYREYPISELQSRVESLVNIVKDAGLDDFGIEIGSYRFSKDESEWIYLDEAFCSVYRKKDDVVKRWLNALSNDLVVGGVDYKELVKEVKEYIKWHRDIGVSEYMLSVDEYTGEDGKDFHGVTMYSVYTEDGRTYDDFPKIIFEAEHEWVAEEVKQILYSIVWTTFSE